MQRRYKILSKIFRRQYFNLWMRESHDIRKGIIILLSVIYNRWRLFADERIRKKNIYQQAFQRWSRHHCRVVIRCWHKLVMLNEKGRIRRPSMSVGIMAAGIKRVYATHDDILRRRYSSTSSFPSKRLFNSENGGPSAVKPFYTKFTNFAREAQQTHAQSNIIRNHVDNKGMLPTSRPMVHLHENDKMNYSELKFKHRKSPSFYDEAVVRKFYDENHTMPNNLKVVLSLRLQHIVRVDISPA